MFDNKTITPHSAYKPHIVYVQGYWRVSAYRRPYGPTKQKWFTKAHSFISKLNNARTTKAWGNGNR